MNRFTRSENGIIAEAGFYNRLRMPLLFCCFPTRTGQLTQYGGFYHPLAEYAMPASLRGTERKIYSPLYERLLPAKLPFRPSLLWRKETATTNSIHRFFPIPVAKNHSDCRSISKR